MVFHWNLSDSKSPQVSRTLLSIFTDLSNVVVLIVSGRLDFQLFQPLIKPLGIVLREPFTTGMTVMFVLHSFSSSLARFKKTSFSLAFPLWSTGKAKFTCWQVAFIIIIIVIIIYSLRDFTLVLADGFTGFWVTASLLKSSGLFSVFWPFSIML